MSQIGRNLTDAVDGIVKGKRYLIHDRDPLFTTEFLKMLADVGVKAVKLPPRSPNLNAHAERFVRSIKESCLNRMIFFGEASPIAFPIAWHNSKIPGYAVRVSVPEFHGFTALTVMSSVAARFFPPQVGGVPFLPAPGVFRIDHDELFNQTTHFQYQPWKKGPWVAFNWRYDNGLVAGAVPCVAPTATCSFSTSPADGGIGVVPGTTTPLPAGQIALVNNLTGLPLTADQEFQAGLTCDGKPAAPSPTGPALATCDAAGLSSTLIKIPKPGKENDDRNPQRIAPRHLFDIGVGHDNLFNGDRYKWSLRFTVINLTNKEALYNFFSTFSGTHYVTPRTETVELAFHF